MLANLLNGFSGFPIHVEAERSFFNKLDIDVFSNETSYHLSVRLPGGVKKEDIGLSFENKRFIFDIKTQESQEKEGYVTLVKNITSLEIKQIIYLRDDIDESTIKAEIKDGILHVTVNKMVRTNKIAIM